MPMWYCHQTADAGPHTSAKAVRPRHLAGGRQPEAAPALVTGPGCNGAPANDSFFAALPAAAPPPRTWRDVGQGHGPGRATDQIPGHGRTDFVSTVLRGIGGAPVTRKLAVYSAPPILSLTRWPHWPAGTDSDVLPCRPCAPTRPLAQELLASALLRVVAVAGITDPGEASRVLGLPARELAKRMSLSCCCRTLAKPQRRHCTRSSSWRVCEDCSYTCLARPGQTA